MVEWDFASGGMGRAMSKANAHRGPQKVNEHSSHQDEYLFRISPGQLAAGVFYVALPFGGSLLFYCMRGSPDVGYPPVVMAIGCGLCLCSFIFALLCFLTAPLWITLSEESITFRSILKSVRTPWRRLCAVYVTQQPRGRLVSNPTRKIKFVFASGSVRGWLESAYRSQTGMNLASALEATYGNRRGIIKYIKQGVDRQPGEMVKRTSETPPHDVSQKAKESSSQQDVHVFRIPPGRIATAVLPAAISLGLSLLFYSMYGWASPDYRRVTVAIASGVCLCAHIILLFRFLRLPLRITLSAERISLAGILIRVRSPWRRLCVVYVSGRNPTTSEPRPRRKINLVVDSGPLVLADESAYRSETGMNLASGLEATYGKQGGRIEYTSGA